MWGSAAPINPDTHKIVVTATGHADKSYTVTVAATEQNRLDVAPGQAVEEPSPKPTPAPAPSEADHGAAAKTSSGTKTLGYIIGGVGVAGIAVGAVTGGMVFGKKSIIDKECRPAARPVSTPHRPRARSPPSAP